MEGWIWLMKHKKYSISTKFSNYIASINKNYNNFKNQSLDKICELIYNKPKDYKIKNLELTAAKYGTNDTYINEISNNLLTSYLSYDLNRKTENTDEQAENTTLKQQISNNVDSINIILEYIKLTKSQYESLKKSICSIYNKEECNLGKILRDYQTEKNKNIHNLNEVVKVKKTKL